MSEGTDSRTVAAAVAEASDFAEPMDVDPAPDRTRRFTSMGFSRMRTNWNAEEASVISVAHAQVELELTTLFADVYRILHRIYEVVRTPLRDADTGGVRTDPLTRTPMWERDDIGMYIEDWSLLTDREKESFLHQITTRLVLWEQTAGDLKGEALYAKALWEERYAAGFVGTPLVENRRPTVDDRTQEATLVATEARYMAIYMTVRSNRADALVRSTERLAQRLKDTLG